MHVEMHECVLEFVSFIHVFCIVTYTFAPTCTCATYPFRLQRDVIARGFSIVVSSIDSDGRFRLPSKYENS